MKTIIAGSRSVNDYKLIEKVIKLSGFEITEIVSGNANGVDKIGELYADAHNIPKKLFPADWNNIKVEGAVIKTNKYGKKYNAKAGIDRNIKMAEYADCLIAIIQDGSPGTTNMINIAHELGLQVYIWEI